MPLPPGLALNPVTGEISGVPTTPGVYSFGLKVRDSQGVTRVIPQSITVAAYSPVLFNENLEPGDLLVARGVLYSVALATIPGTGTEPLTFSVASGTLPTGVILDNNELFGTPTDTTYTDRAVTLRVVDGVGSSDQYAITLKYRDALALAGTLPAGVDGTAYSQSLTRTGGHAPFTYSISSGALPPGFSLNATTGVISGTTSTNGSFPFTVRVEDAAGNVATSSQTLVVSPAYTPISITGAAANTTQNVVANTSFTAAISYAGISITGGLGPGALSYSWARISGSTAISAASPTSYQTQFIGNVAPGANVSALFRCTVTDGVSSASFDVNLSITNTYVVITITGNPTDTSQQVESLSAFSITPNYGSLVVTGGSGSISYSWVRISGSTAISASAPSSLATSFAGTVSPQTTVSATFRLTASDGLSSATKDVTISVENAYVPLQFPPLSENFATRTVAYSLASTAAGGVLPYTYALVSGTLPTGITLNTSTGLISGTPTDTSYTNRTIVTRVTDALGGTATRSFTLTYRDYPTLSYPASVAMRTRAFTVSPTQLAGHGGGGYTIVAGSLPAGLSLNATTGVVSGTPTSTSYGDASVTVRYTDQRANVVDAVLALTYTDNLAVSNAAATPIYAGVAPAAFSYAAAGGTGPVSWSIVSGSLPAGVSLNGSTGALTGTPTTVQTASYTVRATDANGFTADRAETVQVLAPVEISARTVTARSTIFGTDISASAGFRLNASGAAETYVDDDDSAATYTPISGEWLLGGPAGNFSSRATLVSGPAPDVGALNTLQNLGTSRQWIQTSTTSGTGSFAEESVLDIEIVRDSDSVTIDTARITLRATAIRED